MPTIAFLQTLIFHVAYDLTLLPSLRGDVKFDVAERSSGGYRTLQRSRGSGQHDKKNSGAIVFLMPGSRSFRVHFAGPRYVLRQRPVLQAIGRDRQSRDAALTLVERPSSKPFR
jgi:hypothetical protein